MASLSERKKWLILPCSGIGKNVGTVARWAAYELVDKLRPEVTRLLCLARLTIEDPEVKEILQTSHIITIDGCPSSCASLNVERNGGRVVKKYLMSKFLAKHKDLKLERDITDPGKHGLELAKRIAQDISNDMNLFTEAK